VLCWYCNCYCQCYVGFCREQATGEITDLRQKLGEMSENLSSMSDRLKETNEQLAFNIAKRQSNRWASSSACTMMVTVNAGAC
jgi:hypothetical protein